MPSDLHIRRTDRRSWYGGSPLYYAFRDLTVYLVIILVPILVVVTFVKSVFQSPSTARAAAAAPRAHPAAHPADISHESLRAPSAPRPKHHSASER